MRTTIYGGRGVGLYQDLALGWGVHFRQSLFIPKCYSRESGFNLFPKRSLPDHCSENSYTQQDSVSFQRLWHTVELGDLEAFIDLLSRTQVIRHYFN